MVHWDNLATPDPSTVSEHVQKLLSNIPVCAAPLTCQDLRLEDLTEI
jgi:hypothetical protein